MDFLVPPSLHFSCEKLLVYPCVVTVSVVPACFPGEGVQKEERGHCRRPDQHTASEGLRKVAPPPPARPACLVGKLVVSTAIETAANIAHCDGKRARPTRGCGDDDGKADGKG